MLGQPASSQTVCRPSRRTSDLSSVYSGPVLSRVLIHSGLRSIGTWLLRTSRRRSLRPDGSIGAPEEGVGSTVSLMISTVPADTDAPAARGNGGVGTGSAGSHLPVVGAGGRPLVRAAAGAERVGRGVARGVGGGDRLAGVAGGRGHGVLSVAGHRTVTGGRGRPGVVLLAAQQDERCGTRTQEHQHPWPAARLRGPTGLAMQLD